MSVPVEHPFGVWHEAEDESGWVADPGDAVVGAVDVGFVSERHEAGVYFVVILEDESALGMGVGESAQFWVLAELGESLGPDAVGGLVDIHDRPVVDEAAVFVLAEGDGGFAGFRVSWEESELDEDLEAVANADDGDAAIAGGFEFWEEVFAGVHGFDSS